jgi:hypothetical protein
MCGQPFFGYRLANMHKHAGSECPHPVSRQVDQFSISDQFQIPEKAELHFSPPAKRYGRIRG